MPSYDASSIKVLEGLAPVRERPGMYIGSTDTVGLHHLVWEIVDNSIDEAMAGYCNKIEVILTKDGGISIQDNGRGIPVAVHPTEHVPAVQVVLTKLHAGGKFDEKVYSASGGLHGVGASCVNALSSHLKVMVWRDGARWEQYYEKGVPTSGLEKVKMPRGAEKTGTWIGFSPDPTIFETVEFDPEVIAARLQELAYLNPGLRLTFFDLRRIAPGATEATHLVFESKGGLADYLSTLAPDHSIQKSPIEFSGEVDKIKCSVAMRWTKGGEENTRAYCNNIHTAGGTHLTGFRLGVTRWAGKILPKYLPKKMDPPTPEDIREGLVTLLSCRVPQPQFEGQTKAKLATSAAQGAVATIVYQRLTEFSDSASPDVLRSIAERIINASRIRMASTRARDHARKVADMSADSLPGKLSDCQSQSPAECEIFIVEGQSAGGSAKSARNRKNQAILPLRGKVLNCEKATMENILKNVEIQTVLAALGIGIGKKATDLSHLRYHKVIIMTDADVDGSHIRTLLLTLFYRFMPELILNGHLYIAQPPLFRVKQGKRIVWAFNAAGLAAALDGFGDAKPTVSRFKGLGEMPPEMLWETTMDPARRQLLQVGIKSPSSDQIFQVLMGDEVIPRAEFITQNAQHATLDI